jgi:hypothetical protein
MKWVVGAIVVVSVTAAANAVVRSRRRNAKAARSTWTRAAEAATGAASAAANGVKGAVTQH